VLRLIVDLIVVFKKEIMSDQAKNIMDKIKYPKREGMDSSKGKAYFYRTGPKYVVEVPDEGVKELKEQLDIKHVYEVYRANWDVRKD